MKRILLFALIQIVLLTGCLRLAPEPEPAADVPVSTQVAMAVEKTLQAQQYDQIQLTKVYETVVAAVTLTAPIPTETALPTPTVTLEPPTLTPTSTITTTPTATSEPALCNHAQFVKDMTVADEAEFPPLSEFTKVWRLKNIGTCTWTTDYRLIFDGGDKLGGATVKFPKNVAPGEVVDIAVSLQAPGSKGTYKGYWILKDNNENQFGIGARGKSPVWVLINVVNQPPRDAYDFAANFTTASWKTDKATLYPHGTSAGYTNYVQYTTNFQMESGKREDEPALIVNVGNGERVRGKYPAYLVQPGDRFVSQVGCVYGAVDCKARVTLVYQVLGTDTTGILGEWSEKYDGSTTMINIDLSSLAGNEVIFILDVEAKSQSKTNTIFWFVPRVRNP